MPALDNPRHEAFAQAVASGAKGAVAYRRVYGENIKSARGSAYALLKDQDISARVRELSEKSADATVMALREEMEFLTQVVTTPIDQIDETSVLCQRYRYKPDGSRELWMVDKLGALRLLAELKRELTGAAMNISVTNTVNTLTPERQAELQRRKRASIERNRAADAARN